MMWLANGGGEAGGGRAQAGDLEPLDPYAHLASRLGPLPVLQQRLDSCATLGELLAVAAARVSRPLVARLKQALPHVDHVAITAARLHKLTPRWAPHDAHHAVPAQPDTALPAPLQERPPAHRLPPRVGLPRLRRHRPHRPAAADSQRELALRCATRGHRQRTAAAAIRAVHRPDQADHLRPLHEARHHQQDGGAGRPAGQHEDARRLRLQVPARGSGLLTPERASEVTANRLRLGARECAG
jgi:hypothetical protein